MLPDIRAAVDSSLKIFVDCGVCSGYDAYKAPALGADGVSVGTHLIPYVQKGSPEIVADRIREMNLELRGLMASTGVKDCRSFDPTVIHLRQGSGI